MSDAVWLWPAINLVWSVVLAIAMARFYFLCRQWENKFEKRNRWIAEQERKQRQL
jgi:hypothetical protein